MYDSLKLTGTANSIDICNSTGHFTNEHKATIIVDKLAKLVSYSIDNTRCMLVRHTGDGALLFFPENVGFSSATIAVESSIEFISNWKNCQLWFEELKDIDIRISLAYGDVYSNEDGGLWSGQPLNIASKIKHPIKEFDNNRVIISSKVFENICQNSIYKLLFKQSSTLKFKDENVKIYNLCLAGGENYKPLQSGNKNVDIAICLLAINISTQKLRCVLRSIEIQSVTPKYVVIATSHDNISECKSEFLNIEYIDIDNMESKARACVRNILQNRIQVLDVKHVLFLDGDTVISKNALKVANNLLMSSKDMVLMIPRINLDKALNDSESIYATNIFFENDEYPIPFRGFSYISTFDKTPIKSIQDLVCLASYALFVPMDKIKIVGSWDENFIGWGEEDIDFTYRLSLVGCKLTIPQLEGFLCLHLTHEVDGSQNKFLKNVQYLLSKYPQLYNYRKNFYNLLGV